MIFVLLVILSLIFIPEGLGLPYGRELSFILILTVPPSLLLYDRIIKDRKIFFPKQISMLFALFFVFSIISSLFSLNRALSLTYLVFYFSLFLTFIYVVNHKEEFSKAIKLVILGLAILFILYSFLIQLFIDKDWFFLIPDSGFQFVYSKFGSHNHLGDFLVLSLILAFYYLIKSKRKIYYVFLTFFLPFFLLSFSRSAYISLSITLLLLYLYFLRNKTLRLLSWLSALIVSFSLVSLTFSLITVREAKLTPLLKEANQVLTENFNLRDKYFRAKRVEYLNQAISSFIEKPLFGVGPGNFAMASKKYTNIKQWTFSSHNLFLDVLVENGFFAFVIFFLIILRIFTKVKKLNASFVLFIAMLINFQGDYIHAIYSFFFLFFILMGLVYTNPTK